MVRTHACQTLIARDRVDDVGRVDRVKADGRCAKGCQTEDCVASGFTIRLTKERQIDELA